ncbi:MAG: fumarylacetoacetate hydrolase family protein [Chloroflexi bacterium]|nr:fumarylacetoacetate hydrolase family protein [Chloroflexota bacterium]
MRFARLRVRGREHYGLIEGEQARLIRGSPFGRWEATTQVHSLDSVQFRPPTQPLQALGIGGNYADHIAQAEATSGKAHAGRGIQPWVKGAASLIGHGAPIVITREAQEVHYEAELVIVIGRRCRRASKAEARDCILGYTCGNDVSEKASWEKDLSFWRAKGIPSWGPVGPWVATDVDPTKGLDLIVRVNGQEHHRTNTKFMFHDVYDIVSYMSQYTWLFPGDVIFTGAAGVSRALKPGDVVEVEIEGIGTLSNPVVSEGLGEG